MICMYNFLRRKKDEEYKCEMKSQHYHYIKKNL
jgi:hypothetical protein